MRFTLRRLAEPAPEEGGGVTVGLLGQRRLIVAGRDEALDLRPIPAFVLAQAVTAGPGGVGRDAVAALIWPDEPERRARKNVSQALTEIRACFEKAGAPDLETRDGSIRLPAGISSDLAAAWSQLQGAPEEALAAAIRFEATFLGDVSPGKGDAERWLQEARATIAEEVKSVLTGRVVADPSGPLAPDLAAAALAFDPYDEEAQARLCETLVLSGRPREALRRARRAEALLREEIGVGPGPALLETRRRAERHAALPVSFRPPRIAVLAFRARGDDPRLAAVAEGLRLEIAEGLTREADLSVLGRSLADAGPPGADWIDRLMRERGVDFLIEGDVATTAEGGVALRVRAVNAGTGFVAWEETVTARRGAAGALLWSEIVRRLARLLGSGAAHRDDPARDRLAARVETFAIYAEARRRYDAFDVEGAPPLLVRLLGATAVDGAHPQSWLLIAYLCEVMMVRGVTLPGADVGAIRRAAILRAAALDPHDGRILIERGDLHFGAGEFDAADACYERAAAATRGGGELFFVRAKYLAGALGDDGAARRSLARAAEVTGAADPWLASNTLRTRLLLGDFEAALETARGAAPSPIHLACHALGAYGAEEFEEARDAGVRLLRRPGGGRLLAMIERQQFLPYVRRAPAAAPLRRMAARIDALVGAG